MKKPLAFILLLAWLCSCTTQPFSSLESSPVSNTALPQTPTETMLPASTKTVASTPTQAYTSTSTETTTHQPITTTTPRPTSTNTKTPTPIPPYEILKEMFEYNPERQLDLTVVKEENRAGITVQTVKYYGAERWSDRKALWVPAYLVLPEGDGPFPAILYLHAGGKNKNQYLDEGILLAQQGVVCLLIDGPLSSTRGSRLNPFDAAAIREAYIRTVIDLRRGIDVLESLPQVDPNRMAYVGHSYGATWGGVLAGVETRLRAYVLMAGYAQISKKDTPQVPDLDAIWYLGHAAPAAYLFQFAEEDVYIDHEGAQFYFDAANEPKSLLWYDTDHFTLQYVGQADRLSWLSERLGFVAPPQK